MRIVHKFLFIAGFLFANQLCAQQDTIVVAPNSQRTLIIQGTPVDTVHDTTFVTDTLEVTPEPGCFRFPPLVQISCPDSTIALVPQPDSLSIHPRSFTIQVDSTRQLFAVLWFGSIPTVCSQIGVREGWAQVTLPDSLHDPVLNQSSSALFVPTPTGAPDLQCQPQLTNLTPL